MPEQLQQILANLRGLGAKRLAIAGSIVGLVLLVIGAALAEKSGEQSALMSPTAARLGDASYAVYMIHMPLIIPMAFFLRRAHLMGTPAAWGVVAVFFAVLIAVSIATHRYFEGPMRRIIRDALSPSRPRATPDRSSQAPSAG